MLTADDIHTFHDTGFLMLRGLIGPAELAALRSDADRVIAEGVDHQPGGHSYTQVGDALRYYRTDGLWHLGRAFRALTVKPELLAAVGQCIGHPFRPINDSMVVKLPYSGVAVPWHQDPPYSGPHPRATTFHVPNFVVDVYLDDSTLENGCLFGMKARHLAGHVDLDAASQDELFDRDDAVPIQMSAGDVLFHSVSSPHGSKANDSGALRRIVYIHYMADEVLHALHPEWIGREAGGPDQALREPATMLAEAMAEPLLEDAGVQWDGTHFEFVGEPCTPPHHWRLSA